MKLAGLVFFAVLTMTTVSSLRAAVEPVAGGPIDARVRYGARRQRQIGAATTQKAFHDFRFTDRTFPSGIRFQSHAVDDVGKYNKPIHYDHATPSPTPLTCLLPSVVVLVVTGALVETAASAANSAVELNKKPLNFKQTFRFISKQGHGIGTGHTSARTSATRRDHPRSEDGLGDERRLSRRKRGAE